MKQDSFESGAKVEELRAVLAIIDTEVNRQLSEQIRSAESLINRAVLLLSLIHI